MRLGVEIIPVLVGGAHMPVEDELPVSIRTLTRRQAVRLTDEGWDDDVRRLATRVAQLVPAPPRSEPQRPGPEPRGSPIVGIVSAVILLAIVGGIGFVIYRFATENGLGANPKISLSPASGPPGTKVTVSGTGFPHNTDIEIILLGPVAETVSDGDGSFRTTFTVPDTPFTGVHDVLAAGGAFSDTAQFRIDGG
jgi:hypothetical protein